MNISDWLSKSETFLSSRGVDETAANAEFIMADVLRIGRGALKIAGGRNLTREQGRRFWNLVKKRGERQPLAYVLGSQPFMEFEIKVSPDVLVPRPETEQVVEEAVRLIRGAGLSAPRILEIGSGTGCIAVALARRFSGGRLIASDLSVKALRIAALNAKKHGCLRRIRFIREDFYRPLAWSRPWADLVISNPPYIPSQAIPALDPEVLREPLLALDGGEDGLSALRAVIALASKRIKPGGFLVLEIGDEQGPAVAALLDKSGFGAVAVCRDAQGRQRIVVGRRA